MSLIIKDKFPMMMAGYPTVSDKYNVLGGILEGDTDVEFGTLVQYGDTTGYYKAATSKDNLAGFVLATNVKLNETFAGDTVKVHPGEAFNLLLDGFIAVPLDTGAKAETIKPNGKVYVTTTGKVTCESTSNTELTNCTFTGMHETHGATIVAEIYVK